MTHTLTSDDFVRELNDFWSLRWRKHSNLSPDAWHRITSFIRAFVPTGRFTCHHCLASTLIALPEGLMASTTGIFSRCQVHLWINDSASCMRSSGGHAWLQLLQIHLFNILRSTASQSIDVILVSMIYRAWSTLRARQVMKVLAAMPKTLEVDTPEAIRPL